MGCLYSGQKSTSTIKWTKVHKDSPPLSLTIGIGAWGLFGDACVLSNILYYYFYFGVQILAKYTPGDPIHWAECVELLERYNIQGRFSFPGGSVGGPNCSDLFTFSDVTGAFGWVLTAPWDFILRLPAISEFFEIAQPAIGHGTSYAGGAAAYCFFGMLLACIFWE